jgi:FKBP-type peptidyl-prolyl cis-trans isomerase
MISPDGSSENMDECKATSTVTQLLIPGSDTIDISPNKDGGVLKEIQKPGIGCECPLIGDHVAVSYDAMFADGSRFDSSHFQGDQKFEFILGKGSVVKAWDLAVATMRAGEKSRFYCQDHYVYTDESLEKSPQNTSGYVIYDIELLHWQGADVSKRKDGGIRKSILVRGEGHETPNDGATCEAHITGTYNSHVFEDHDVTFILGEGSEAGIVSGVEIALRKFRKGERSRLKVMPRYGYGSEGNKEFAIPSDAELVYEVELKNFVRVKDFWQMNSAELASSAEKFKERGTEFFQAGKYELARHQYKKVVHFLTCEASTRNAGCDTNTTTTVNSLLLAAHLNLAMCYLKLSKERQACDSCDSALALDPNNIKALYRRGLANLGLKCLEEAHRDFSTVIKLEPCNKAARDQLSLTVQKQAEEAARERLIFAGMFQKFAQRDTQHDRDGCHGDSDVFSNIGEWSNELASGMMTLEQEMAAFGEKMPEPKYKRGGGKENERPDSDDEEDDDDD